MERRDWFGIGLKLLGVYFGVNGVASLWNVLVVLMAASGGGLEGIGAVGILQPAVYLVAAFLLVRRTRTCLSWCGELGTESERPET